MKRRQPACRVKLNPRVVWERLNRLNITQNRLAAMLGITSGYLSQLMTGTRSPSAEVRRRLQEVLEVPNFDDLFILEVVE